MIESLTPEQEAQMPTYEAKWNAIGLSTEPIDREKIRPLIDEVYRKGDLEPPKNIIIVDGAETACRLQAYLKKENHESDDWESIEASLPWDEIMTTKPDMSGIVFGSHEAGWLSFYDFFREQVGLKEETEQLTGIIEASKEMGWFIPMVDLCIVSERPNSIHLDEEGRLHNEDEPALTYPDGHKLYCIHGIRVPDHFIENKQDITVDMIDKEENQELRRILIDLLGMETYTKDAVELQRDDFGILYQKPQDEDEDIFVVKVVNATAELDGSFKDYWIRVPPNTQTAHEGIAWSFGETIETYEPQYQT